MFLTCEMGCQLNISRPQVSRPITMPICIFTHKSDLFFSARKHSGLYIKVGRGQGNGDIGTPVWGLGTWGRETRDLGTSSMGRVDAGTSKTGTQGTRDVNDYRKSRR